MMHKSANPFPWIIIHLGCAILITLFLIAAINHVGYDIIAIYLRTSRRSYPVLFFSLCGVFIILNILLSARAAGAYIKKKRYMSFRAAAAVTVAMAVMFLSLAEPFLRMQRRPANAAESSARERFWAALGPVVQFGPFVDRRTDSSSSMVIWYFDPLRKEEPAILRYGRNPLPAAMVSLPEAAGDGKRHEFHLTGLSPATRYYYRVPAFGDTVHSFITGPPPGSGAPFSFIAVGDTDSSRKGGYGYSYLENVMKAAAATYRDRGQEPAFLIHAGDMVRTGADIDAWHHFFSTLPLIDSIPMAVTPGNHDYLVDRGANFHYFFGQPDYFTVDYGDARLFFIHPFDGPGTTLDGPVITTGKEQYRWLRRELARGSGRKWTIVVIHTPILSTGDYGVNELLAAQYLQLFREHRVDLVISGHDHNFDSYHVDERADWGGTLYIVTGTGGSTVDSYIMDRPSRRWLHWRHDRNSPHGLYQRDPYTRAYHRYGELSWGYTDVEVRSNALSVSYYRWLDLESFIGITGQDRHRWDMVYLSNDELARNNLLQATRVKQIDKKK
ncbi:MAG: metallophosphoesterase family protein [Spirochaetes bacterium]|nr:metallophosphoesterase family protein [Spirochaetota bacterium]